jgi:hypothetical protein
MRRLKNLRLRVRWMGSEKPERLSLWLGLLKSLVTLDYKRAGTARQGLLFRRCQVGKRGWAAA